MPPTCRGRAGPEGMGRREEEAALSDKHGAVVKGSPRRALGGGRKGSHRISPLSATTTSSISLSDKKGFAGRLCGLAGRGFHPYHPTLWHMLVVSLDQRVAAV